MSGRVDDEGDASAPPAPPTPKAPKERRPRRRELPRGLPPWRRLRTTRDFSRVERQGTRSNGKFTSVTVRPGPGRVGFVVSKKVDNKAHERNLIKRRLRAMLREEKSRYVTRPAAEGGSVDVVVQAHPASKGVSYDTLRADVLATLEAAMGKLAKARAAKPPPSKSRSSTSEPSHE